MSGDWLPEQWWRFSSKHGAFWLETDDEREARAALLAGARVERMWRREETEWRPVP